VARIELPDLVAAKFLHEASHAMSFVAAAEIGTCRSLILRSETSDQRPPQVTPDPAVGAEFPGQFTQAKAHVFEYIEVDYNRNRLHSALRCFSPEQFEHANAV
jgi:hypothetical protein